MELKQIYNRIAQDFSQTRQKPRVEFEFIKNQLETFPSKKIKILDVGSWDGRLRGYLRQNLPGKEIEFWWLDFAEKFVNLAKNKYPDANWILWDMLELNKYFEPLSFDFVVFVASFHHLKTFSQRLKVLKQTYQILKYPWKAIFVNWNLRNPRYYKLFLKGVLKNLLRFNRGDISWVYVPWKKDGKVLQRYYHIFWQKELADLLRLAGFDSVSWFFVYPDGSIGSKRRWARNLFTVAEKKEI